MTDYDLVIIGAGWAGFNAALRARELGLKVALIEKSKIGGTCLNLGCIPTKALVQSAKVYSLTKKSADFGIDISLAQINFSKIQERKAKIIQQLGQGIQFQLKGIDIINATAEIISPEQIKAGTQTIQTKNILIATGSKPLELKSLKFDHQKILSSDDILNLNNLPKSLIIIGGGVIGCEFASLVSIFGTEVTIVELMPQLLPGVDKEVAKKLETSFKKKGIKILTNTDAVTFDRAPYQLTLLAIGRAPVTDIPGLDKLNLQMRKTAISVDEYLKTNIPNIYSAGDCTGQTMLAHFAAYQGRIAAENLASPENPQKADNQTIPNCIFTDPEIAAVGLDEEKAGQKGIEPQVHRFDFLGSGMARILDETDGFIKIISDKKSGQIVGASIIGPKATELIGILTLAISSRLTISQIKETIFAHPTLSESIPECFGDGS